MSVGHQVLQPSLWSGGFIFQPGLLRWVNIYITNVFMHVWNQTTTFVSCINGPIYSFYIYLQLVCMLDVSASIGKWLEVYLQVRCSAPSTGAYTTTEFYENILWHLIFQYEVCVTSLSILKYASEYWSMWSGRSSYTIFCSLVGDIPLLLTRMWGNE